jgi:hypothetical protein
MHAFIFIIKNETEYMHCLENKSIPMSYIRFIFSLLKID